jgi:two-component system cell cycle sensor histidine kinase/response regulator CckA
MHLCDNARDAMLNGGILRIFVENLWVDADNLQEHAIAEIGPYILITVADTGFGVSAENLNRIFDPFFTTKAFGQGTGLGLSRAVGIIKGHGGALDVSSVIDKGTQFKVYLPAIPRSIPGIPQPEASLNRLILLIDGNPLSREMARATLVQGGYQVLTASDGIEAIALYARHWSQICLVVLDMAVPELDGPTVVQAMHKINPQVRVVATTPKALINSVSAGLKDALKAVLQQPYTPEELSNTVQTALTS